MPAAADELVAAPEVDAVLAGVVEVEVFTVVAVLVPVEDWAEVVEVVASVVALPVTLSVVDSPEDGAGDAEVAPEETKKTHSSKIIYNRNNSLTICT